MPSRIVILTEGHSDPQTAKTASSVVRYRTEEVVALLDSTQAGRTSGDLLGVGGEIPVVASLEEAPQADTLLIGIAPAGGKLPEAWRPVILAAVRRGMQVVSGLHDFVSDDAEFAEAAGKHGARLVDVRKNRERSVARRQGIRAGCLRILTVGTDCSIGKMVTAIEVTRALHEQGEGAAFVATGQTGIMIAGEGCPIDTVVADFVSGAVERLVLANQHHRQMLIEGQGSLFHPSYSGVTLSLLHGSQPQGMILCHEVGRQAIHGIEEMKLPTLRRAVEIYETMASLMHPSRVIGVSLNTRALEEAAARAEIDRVSQELSLPVCDVFRGGAQPLVEAVLRLQDKVM